MKFLMTSRKSRTEVPIIWNLQQIAFMRDITSGWLARMTYLSFETDLLNASS